MFFMDAEREWKLTLALEIFATELRRQGMSKSKFEKS